LDSMLFKKKGEFLKVLDHILNRGANNCGGHCIWLSQCTYSHIWNAGNTMEECFVLYWLDSTHRLPFSRVLYCSTSFYMQYKATPLNGVLCWLTVTIVSISTVDCIMVSSI